MKQTKQWVLAAMLTIFGLGLLSACAANDDNAVENRDLLDEIRERGYVVVGTTGDYRPLSWLNPETEQYEGLDADLSAIIAEELGVELRWYHTSWPTINTDALDPSKFDMANCGITITDKRLETLAMSEPYLDNGKTILCRAEDAARFTSLESLNREDVRVMVNPGGLNEQFARQQLPRAQLIIYNQNEEIPARIAEGDADVMITEIVEAPYYVRTDPRLAAPLISQPFTHGHIGILMRQDCPRLLEEVNAIIGRMKRDGRLDRLKEKYL